MRPLEQYLVTGITDATLERNSQLNDGRDWHYWDGRVEAFEDALRTLHTLRAEVAERIGYWQLRLGQSAYEDSDYMEAVGALKGLEEVRAMIVGPTPRTQSHEKRMT